MSEEQAQGKLVLVYEMNEGSHLAQDSDNADTTLYVYDASAFNPDGGTLALTEGEEEDVLEGYDTGWSAPVGDGETEIGIIYTGVDYELNTLTGITGMTYDHTLDDTAVWAEPIVATRMAEMQFEGDDDYTTVRVPFVFYDRVPVGVFDELNGETPVGTATLINEEWVLTDLAYSPNSDPEYLEGYTNTEVEIIFIDQNEFDPDSSTTRPEFGTTPDLFKAFLVSDGGSDGFYGLIEVPDNYVVDTELEFRVVFQTSTDSGNNKVSRWDITYKVVENDRLGTAGTTDSYDMAHVDMDTALLFRGDWWSLGTDSGLDLDSNPRPTVIQMTVLRKGGHANDTTSSDLKIVGVELRYTKSTSSLIGPTGDTGAQGATGSAGADGTNGAAGTPGSVWREGTGAPSNGLGVDGDFYLNDADGDVYLKAGGSYSVVANIKGPTGNTGATGSQGPAGSNGLFSAAGVGFDDNGGTLDWDPTEFTQEKVIEPITDMQTIYDISSSANRKVAPSDLTGFVLPKYTAFESDLLGHEPSDILLPGGIVIQESGGGSYTQVSEESGHFGIKNHSVGTTNNSTGYSRFYTDGDTTLPYAGWSKIKCTYIIKITSVPASGTDATIQLGFYETASPFRFLGAAVSFGVNSAQWIVKAVGTGSSITGDSSIGMDTSWHRIQTVFDMVNYDGELFIDGTSVASFDGVSTNFPAQDMSPVIGITKTGAAHTTARAFSIDAYRYEFEFATAR